MKYTVANNELNLGGKNGLYCFLPYERLDDDYDNTRFRRKTRKLSQLLSHGGIYVFLPQPCEDETRSRQGKKHTRNGASLI